MQLELNSNYADIMELALYNAVLSGMSHDGKSFTYVNQLASSAGNPSRRYEWFDCPCCPPNVLRFLGSLSGYLWHWDWTAEKKVEMNIFLYTDTKVELNRGEESGGNGSVNVTQKTKWPLDGEVEFEVDGAQDIDVVLRLRIPAWANEWKVEIGSFHILQLYLSAILGTNNLQNRLLPHHHQPR